MTFKVQHIGRIFTFLAGMIIWAHAVVPHHHHYELTLSLEQESTCENHAQEKSNEDPVAHCHAFNTLVTGKTTNSYLNQSLSECFFYLAGINDNIKIPPVKNITTTIFGHQAVFKKQLFFTAHSLRAPPVV